jgi:hypothetical protein
VVPRPGSSSRRPMGSGGSQVGAATDKATSPDMTAIYGTPPHDLDIPRPAPGDTGH